MISIEIHYQDFNVDIYYFISVKYEIYNKAFSGAILQKWYWQLNNSSQTL